MRISDWSSDLCSSDLRLGQTQDQTRPETARRSRTKMRIIAGQWRGRPLVAPKGDATRPTADRTREALFSMLASRLGSFEDLAIADLFAGSGALGPAALWRGAASCLFAEQEGAAADGKRPSL